MILRNESNLSQFVWNRLFSIAKKKNSLQILLAFKLVFFHSSIIESIIKNFHCGKMKKFKSNKHCHLWSRKKFAIWTRNLQIHLNWGGGWTRTNSNDNDGDDGKKIFSWKWSDYFSFTLGLKRIPRQQERWTREISKG